MLELITPVTRAENRKPSDEEILHCCYNFINFLTEHRHLSKGTDCHVAGGDKNVSTNTVRVLLSHLTGAVEIYQRCLYIIARYGKYPLIFRGVINLYTV